VRRTRAVPLSLTLLAAVTLTGCVTSVRPLADDFSDEPPDEALSHTLDRLEDVYAFGDWKAIDWSEARQRLGDAMDAADTQAGQDQVFRALVELLPDGHVDLWNDDPSRDLCPEASGGLGVTFSDTDDAGVIVVTAAGNPGADISADIDPGDTLIAVNGVLVEDALEATPLRCYPIGLAAWDRRRFARLHLLARAEVGAEVTLTLGRSGETWEVTLTAVDDLGTPEDSQPMRRLLGIASPEVRVDARMLGGSDVGYITLGWEETILSERQVRRAIEQLWEDGARRLVLDIRDNDGGTDQTAANIAGIFTDETWFYETITMYDRRTEAQAVISEVMVTPQAIFWDLPVAVLINGNTVSSGDGMAMMFERFAAADPDIHLVGFEGTAASFGSSGSTIALPGGWTLTWPAGRSLDREGRIQLDSDHTLEGGVQPTHRVPWTAEHRIAHAAAPDDFLIDYAVEHALGGL